MNVALIMTSLALTLFLILLSSIQPVLCFHCVSWALVESSMTLKATYTFVWRIIKLKLANVSKPILIVYMITAWHSLIDLCFSVISLLVQAVCLTIFCILYFLSEVAESLNMLKKKTRNATKASVCNHLKFL